MRHGKWLFLLGLALAIIVFDQVTKALVIANLGLHEQWAPVEALRPYFTFTHVQNTGASFGIFPNGGWVFALVAILVSGLIVYFYRTMPDQTWLIRAALGLQLGGALGNLIDRVRLGYVVDFLDFKFWPVFNVADSALVVGVVVLLLATWRQERQVRAPDGDSPAPPAA